MSRVSILILAIFIALTILSTALFFQGTFCDWPIWTRAGFNSHILGQCGGK